MMLDAVIYGGSEFRSSVIIERLFLTNHAASYALSVVYRP